MLKRLDETTVHSFLTERRRQQFKSNATVTQTVSTIIQDVYETGDAALKQWTQTLDHVTIDTFKIAEEQLKTAWDSLPEALKKALENAKASIETYHQAQAYMPLHQNALGISRTQRITPLARVGIYIPGGTARYPSSVLMNAIPAQVAGVKDIVMVTPPHPEGIDPSVLGAAYLCGVHEVYQVGGAQAIAALAIGTKSIPPVDKIVGPGNIYVATAKGQLSSVVGIDHFAGPSEVLIFADDSVDPAWIAADLMAQAEHDPLAQSILISQDVSVLDAVENALETMLPTRMRKTIIESSLKTNGLRILLPSLPDVYDVINQLAPEHLEIMTRTPEVHGSKIHHAGSIFLGPYTPEAVGDYIGGPNHTLPTSGTARFASGLSTFDFQKRTSILAFDAQAFDRVADDVITLADQEQLEAHALSIRIRKDRQ